jgi:hypothetical protein
MEGFIRQIKARYRRISGRKNWNAYLLRHGRNAPFYDWWDADPERWQNFEHLAQKIDRAKWQGVKQETSSAASVSNSNGFVFFTVVNGFSLH